jgi:hypothetical protein
MNVDKEEYREDIPEDFPLVMTLKCTVDMNTLPCDIQHMIANYFMELISLEVGDNGNLNVNLSKNCLGERGMDGDVYIDRQFDLISSIQECLDDFTPSYLNKNLPKLKDNLVQLVSVIEGYLAENHSDDE